MVELAPAISMPLGKQVEETNVRAALSMMPRRPTMAVREGSHGLEKSRAGRSIRAGWKTWGCAPSVISTCGPCRSAGSAPEVIQLSDKTTTPT